MGVCVAEEEEEGEEKRSGKLNKRIRVQRSKQEEERTSRGTCLLLCCGFGDGGCIELDEFMGVEPARRSLQP